MEAIRRDRDVGVELLVLVGLGALYVMTLGAMLAQYIGGGVG